MNTYETTKTLFEAAKDGDIEAARTALDAGANSNAQDVFGITPLHFAAFNGHTEIAALLLDQGANPNAQEDGVHEGTGNGPTPLHNAAKQGHKGVVELLLDRGADPNVRDDYKYSIYVRDLHETESAAMQAGAGFDAAALERVAPRTEEGRTPAMVAVQEGHLDVAALIEATKQAQDLGAELRNAVMPGMGDDGKADSIGATVPPSTPERRFEDLGKPNPQPVRSNRPRL